MATRPPEDSTLQAKQRRPARGSEHVVARVGELKPGGRKIVTIGGVQIGIFHICDAYYALRNICPHQSGPVATGKVGGAMIANADTGWEPEWFHDGEILGCPWHGLEFRITTGQCLAYPKVRLRHYSVKVEGDEIKVVL